MYTLSCKINLDKTLIYHLFDIGYNAKITPFICLHEKSLSSLIYWEKKQWISHWISDISSYFFPKKMSISIVQFWFWYCGGRAQWIVGPALGGCCWSSTGACGGAPVAARSRPSAHQWHPLPLPLLLPEQLKAVTSSDSERGDQVWHRRKMAISLPPLRRVY